MDRRQYQNQDNLKQGLPRITILSSWTKNGCPNRRLLMIAPMNHQLLVVQDIQTLII